ncbi:MAG TPA: flagellar basal-body MS-ring/collar protein FliF [Bryobacteraceae bacterium]|nr:flagellar basal-body MS-ring/collar protein FliF [Bryobacteraceae bacterium]
MGQVKKLYNLLSPVQRWSIALCGILIAVGIAWFTHWEREGSFRPLFASLSAEDAGAIVQKLKESSVDYRISSNGSVVLVPEAKVAELRLEMAGLGLPKTGRIGFEIFDKTNFGITDFAEHVNYRRAIEGELERSIMSINEVEQARVHVTFPKDSVFVDAREPAKASVLVRLRVGASLQPQNVAAITHLVSSAVEGLAPTAVSVVDMQGNLLSRPKKISADGDMSEAALDYQQKLEHEIQAKISSTLEPLLGPDKFRTALSVECDMTSGEQSDEILDPTKSVMVSSQRTEDASGTVTSASGQPGVAANLPNAPAQQPATSRNPSRRTENVAYQSSRTLRHIRLQQGAIKRLSIAILVDQAVHWEKEGSHQKRVLVPPSADELKTIHDLVATAVGFETQRGDQLMVETLPFDSTMNSTPPEQLPAPGAKPAKPTPAAFLDLLKSNPVYMYGAGGVLLVIVLAGILLLRRRPRRMEVMAAPAALREAAEVADSVSLSNAAAGLSAAAVEHAPEPAQLPPTRMEVITAQLRDSVTRDGELWASVMKSWLAEEDNP